MRLLFATVMAAMASIAVPPSVSAQGVKDPANYGPPTRQATTPTEATRPTTTQNIPTNALPPGVAIQRTYRDGTLVPYVR
ncbi:MAG: hypothetical protein HZA66_03345 [Rhodopseudomonas palustris]|uniref:Uncharacterized protein n=1 Tax=Rhodopseudomonas palustris TaxID=1076 RepID=A0A933RUI8_RHOPL|nr:hypothetical protein [Rhodopseudomonas palustris]